MKSESVCKPGIAAHGRRAVSFALVIGLAACGGQNALDERTEVSLLVVAGTVVTMDPDRAIFTPGAVAIEGTDIVAVGPRGDIEARYRGATVIDEPDRIVLPGLVNTHTHAAMVLFRGLADDLALMEWLDEYIFPAEARTVSPEMVRTGTRLAALEMIRSGTTTFADMYYFEEDAAEVVEESGLRAVLGQAVIQFPVADAETPEDGLARAERLILQYRDHARIVPAVGPHAMYTLDAATLQASRALADRYDVPVLIHLAETQDEVNGAIDDHGMTPVAYLEGLGFWGPRSVAAHAVWVSKADREILRRHGVGVSHNPESNMKLASGVAPVPAYLAEGITVGLGTDGAASNNDLDMFEAMRTAALLHKVQTRDPQAVPAGAALAMATIEGARVLGLEGLIGSLEVGKRADLIGVATDRPGLTPLYDPVSHLVYAARGGDVRFVVVNGAVVMDGGTVTTLDEARVLDEARAMARTVQAAVGR